MKAASAVVFDTYPKAYAPKDPLPGDPVRILPIVRRALAEIGYVIAPLKVCKSDEEFMAIYPPGPLAGSAPHVHPQMRSLIVRTLKKKVRVRTLENGAGIERRHKELIEKLCGDRVLISPWAYNHRNKRGKPRRWIELIPDEVLPEILQNCDLKLNNASS